MDIITPCRKIISERFPILSFVVRAPETRHYEIACATDPRLFHTDYLNSRTQQNFYTTRSDGLLTVNRDSNVWIMPPQQLKRFVGASKIYYALGTYAGKKGENPRFTISPDVLNEVPSIQITSDFTGRSLDRGRFGYRPASTSTYGTRETQHPLRWGGDLALEVQRQTEQTNTSNKQYGHIPYDDGFDPSLWGAQTNGTAIDEDYINDGTYNTQGHPQSQHYNQGMEHGNLPNTYRSQNNDWEDNYNYGRATHPYNSRQRYASVSNADEEQLIQDLVTQSGVDENQIRSFLNQFKGSTINAQERTPSLAMSNNGPTLHLPNNTVLAGWQAAAFIGLIRLTLSSNPITLPLVSIFPGTILSACNRLNITVGIGISAAGGLGAGSGLGAGIICAPGNRIGFYGSSSDIVGWILSISAGIQLTVVHGGPENFSGDAIANSGVVDLSEGPSVGVHILTTTDGRLLGVTGEVSLSLGIPLLSIIEAYRQKQYTSTTLSAQQLTALSNGNNTFDEMQTPALAYGHPRSNSNRENNYGATAYANTSCYGKPGKHSEYRESSIEESQPIGPATHPLGSGESRVLDIPEKVRILRIVGKSESGKEAYSSINADIEFNTPGHDANQRQNTGLSWGFVHFTQRSGMLGKVLQKAKERELALLPPISPEGSLPAEHRFDALFGEHWQPLLNTTDPEFTTSPDERLAPVGEGPLWQEPWLSRFRNAGSVPYIQSAQNEIAVTEYFNKIQRIANWLGIRTARGLAMLLDRVIHAGMGGGMSWIMSSIDPIRSESDRRIALQAVTGNPDDLMSFQQKQGIEANGEWNAITHAALIGALRTMGAQSPIAIPGPDNMLHSLLMAAQGTDFEHRLQALYNDTENFDDNITYELA